jgi:preprotein translocase subunit YajC
MRNRAFPDLHNGDEVKHLKSGIIGKVTGFAPEGTDVMVDHTGPYPQTDFVKLAPVQQAGEPGE